MRAKAEGFERAKHIAGEGGESIKAALKSGLNHSIFRHIDDKKHGSSARNQRTGLNPQALLTPR
jgi:hypothetical protein